ncbi:hypothetical protein [Desulfoluna spongiiphila]|uniref:Heavy-metal resistance n=1 Tax=Desulfoluna spongiiphila TaxID=419481 RepID=A0A1G5AFE8_9BACT|nr:hypothetical protein [Desulfoluna spongiiphila]SCX76620.1 hypothetical protein SAMN05216233_101136 [Desulfoluna spongiiphila]VVS90636.1 hypothetical protein DBB_2030 [Desulfoluna spongiiphila]
MSRKKILVLLAFSLCLNAGFLAATLARHTPSTEKELKHPFRAYTRHMELLRELDLPEETLQQATELLDTFMEQRTALIVKKLDHKLKTLDLLEKNPALSREEFKQCHAEEERIEQIISTLDFEYTLSMRGLLPPDKMALMYAHAAELIRPHRERMAAWKKAAH